MEVTGWRGKCKWMLMKRELMETATWLPVWPLVTEDSVSVCSALNFFHQQPFYLWAVFVCWETCSSNVTQRHRPTSLCMCVCLHALLSLRVWSVHHGNHKRQPWARREIPIITETCLAKLSEGFWFSGELETEWATSHLWQTDELNCCSWESLLTQKELLYSVNREGKSTLSRTFTFVWRKLQYFLNRKSDLSGSMFNALFHRRHQKSMKSNIVVAHFKALSYSPTVVLCIFCLLNQRKQIVFMLLIIICYDFIIFRQPMNFRLAGWWFSPINIVQSYQKNNLTIYRATWTNL